jgi:predicted TIM-barrel fold metal-dependent hydrolase
MIKIDAHVHLAGDHPDCVAMLDQLELKLLNVCVAHDAGEQWRAQAAAYCQLAQAHPDRYAWCTSFDLPDWTPDYAERVIEGLERDLAAGAVGCKIWKNVGMALRKPSGEFLMVDDPLFDPLYACLAREGVPLLMHIGEPLACWQPLREGAFHSGYYSQHPEWHMYGKAGYPSHGEIIAARDRVLARHPDLRAVGAHLGSLEYDVAEVARRLDRYPNLAVDVSARLADLAGQDRETVRSFFLACQDRILFGTDIVQREPFSALPASERQHRLARVQETYQAQWAYFESDQVVALGGREVQGLGLPAHVLQKLYGANAARWYPGL